MSEAPGFQSPTVSGFAARCVIAALRERKIAVEPLLHRAGLLEDDLKRTDRRLGADSQGVLFESAAEAVDDAAFGLRLAQRVNPREAGLLFYAMSAAKNVDEALALLARYARIVHEAVRMKLAREPEGMNVEMNFVGLSRHRFPQNVEFGMALILRAFREIAGRNIRPTRVAFAHARNANRRDFERFFGCPVEFGQSGVVTSDRMIFANATLAVPLVTEDSYLLTTLRPFCEEAAKKRETAPGTIRSAVENEVQKLLPHGKAHAQTVAKALRLSVRTLSRRLADEGTTYAEIVDRVRRSLALQYLEEPGFSLSQIAWLLGYEQTTSFNHAFRRWTGRSPSEARSEKRYSAPAQPPTKREDSIAAK